MPAQWDNLTGRAMDEMEQDGAHETTNGARQQELRLEEGEPTYRVDHQE